MPTNSREYNKQYYIKNKKRIISDCQKYYKLNRDKLLYYQRIIRQNPKIKLDRREAAWKFKGILNENGSPFTEQDYRQFFDIQDGKCKICKKCNSDLKRGLFVDHNHTTGKARGLLCHSCNAGIGHFKDNATLLFSAIQYIEVN